jgi:aspartate carbamoyltransferase regulatory subunit
MKELKVDPIKDGTVIDHIPAGKAFKIIEILKLSEDDQIMIGTNLTSGKMGKKDIIKIENKEFNSEQINSISLIAPNATLTIIQNMVAVSKKPVKRPNKIEGIIKCPNEKCITNREEINSNFDVFSINDKTKLRCLYCEKVFNADIISKYFNI